MEKVVAYYDGDLVGGLRANFKSEGYLLDVFGELGVSYEIFAF